MYLGPMEDSTYKEPSIHIFGGGTTFHIRPGLALTAPSQGRTALGISTYLRQKSERFQLHLTKTAGGDVGLDTTNEVAQRLHEVISNPTTKIVFVGTALCAWEGSLRTFKGALPVGREHPALPTNRGAFNLLLIASDSIIRNLRKIRNDVLLVGFRSTSGVDEIEQFRLAQDSLSCYNLILSNDSTSGRNLLVTGSKGSGVVLYSTYDYEDALTTLVDITLLMSEKPPFSR